MRALEEALQVDKGDAPAVITTTNILKPGKTKFYSPSLKSYFHSYPYVADVDVIYKADEGGKVGFTTEDTKAEVSQTIDKKTGEPQAVTVVADEGYAFLVWTDEEGNAVSYDKSLTIKKQDGVYAAGTYIAKFLKTSDPLDKEALQEAIDAANKAKEDAEKAKEDAEKVAGDAAKAAEAAQKAAEAAQKAAEAAQKAAEAAGSGSVEEAQKAAEEAQKAAEEAQKAAEEAKNAAGESKEGCRGGRKGCRWRR